MANMFNEDGTYNKTEWKAGDKITAVKLNKIELSLEAINNNDIDRHVEADSRLDILEERMANTPDNEQMDALEDMVKDNKDAAELAVYEMNHKIQSLESVNADSRLDALEGVNAGYRLDAVEGVNADSRLYALEYVNADNRLDNLERLMTNDINIQNYSHLVENGDWTIAINTALNDCEDNNSNLYFPNGTYTVSETINLRHKVSMLGQSRLNTIITSNSCTIFNLEGDSIFNTNGKGHIQQCNIKNMALHGPSLQVPSLTAKACSRTSFENVFFYSNNKTMITGVEFFDIRWTDCLFEWAGTSDGSYPMIDFIQEDGYEFNNNHYFYGCLFESYRGMVIRNVCENSTEFKFTNCKFESSFSNSRQFEFENVGVIHFNNCMVSAQGNDVNATVKDIMSFKNCYDIKLDISLYKWDNVNGNRSSYYIPDNLITIDSCYCFDCNIRIFNNTIRLKNDNNPYVKLINAPSDGSDIRVIKRPGDAHIGVRWFTHSMCNNINIKNDSEPCISLTNMNNITYQLGRIADDGTFRIIRYDSSGNESIPFLISNNGCSINNTLFLFEATHLAKLSDDSKVPWWDNGTIYYNTTTNTLRVYINGEWKNITTY